MARTDKKLSERFKPCMLVSFYAHGHRVHDYVVTDRTKVELDDGAEVSSWKTTKRVQDPKNATRAQNLRTQFIKSVCKLGAQYGHEKLVFVDFERRDDLHALKKRWAEEVKDFNAQSPLVKVNFGILPELDLTGSNEYFLGELVDELQNTLGSMKEALQAADYKSVRAIAKRLKGFTSLVPDKAATALVAAVNSARKQARMMVKELEKNGTAIEKVQEMVNTTTVDLAASLTVLDDSPELDSPEADALMGAIVAQQAGALDLDLDEDDDEVVGTPMTGEPASEEPSITTAPVATPDLDEEDDDEPSGGGGGVKVSPALAAAMASWRIDA